MKKIISVLLFFISTIAYSEKIQNYTVFVSLNEDRSVHIKEKIEYNPEEKLVHGLRRYIVKDNLYKFIGFNSKVGIKNFKSNLPYILDENSNYDEYRLGSPDLYLQQDKITIIENSYDIYNIVRTNENLSQIFLNVIGQYWDMPIEKAKIILDFKNNAIKDIYVFTGALKEQTNNYIINGNIIETKNRLSENEGLTVKLNLDKNIYNYSTYTRINNIFKAYNSLRYNTLIIIILIIILIIICVLKFKLKDKRPIEPEFKVDSKISPALAYKVYSSNISPLKSKYSILTIIFYSLLSKDLIVSKDRYEDVEYVLKKGDILHKKDDYNQEWTYEKDKIYSFVDPEKIQEALNGDNLSPEEKQAVLCLFKKREDLLSNDDILKEANSSVSSYVNKIYKTNIGKKIIIPVQFAIILSLINSVFYSDFNISLIVVILLSILDMVLGSKLYFLTEEGRNIIRNIKGFIMYFDATEKNIFDSFKTEKELIDYAKKMLPYAIAVGLQKRFITLLDKAIKEHQYDKNIVYSGMYYGYLYNFNNINDCIYKSTAPKIEKSNYSGGVFSSGSQGYSGGGYSGGGGSSW